MAGAAIHVGYADSSRAPGLASGLQWSVNGNRGALLLVPQLRCISPLVFYIFVTLVPFSLWSWLYSSPRGVRLKCYYAFFLVCCGYDTSYIVSVHIQCHRAPRLTFTDPCKPEARPEARKESASPAWLAAPAMNARDTTKVYIWSPKMVGHPQNMTLLACQQTNITNTKFTSIHRYHLVVSINLRY